MDFVLIKPLSINEAWRGRLFKTKEHNNYLVKLHVMLPPKIKLPPPPYEVYYEFGFSSSTSDWDNPVKPFQDALQKKYGFNDKQIMRAVVHKKLVKKGHEYIGFKISHYE